MTVPKANQPADNSNSMTHQVHDTAPYLGGANPFTMNMFHAALVRDFSRAELLLTNPATLTRRRTVRLGRHLLWLLEALQIHHQGEDDHLWPLLRQREPNSAAVLAEMLGEHHAIDEPMRQLTNAASGLARSHHGDSTTTAQHALAAIRSLIPPLRSHLEHEEQAALPIVRRVLTQREWEQFEKRAWVSRRSSRQTVRFVPWLLDGIEWTPELRTRFKPARRMPVAVLTLLSASSQIPGATVWTGTTAAGTRPTHQPQEGWASER